MNDIDKKFIELSETDMTWVEIGKQLNLSPSAICWRIRKYNLKRKSAKFPKELEDRIIELILQGKKRDEIAAELNIHRNTVTVYAHKNNIKFKERKRVKHYKDIILNMLDLDKSMPEICQVTELSMPAICTFLKNNNYDCYRKRKRKINSDKVLELHNSGLLLNEISAQLAISPITVKSIMKELNIEEHKNKLYKLNIDKLDPYELYISKNIKDIKESERKEFIVNLVKAYINKTKKYVSRIDIINLPCGITTYYLSKYNISIPKINLEYGLSKSQSIFEQCITNYLIRYNYKFEIQKTFDSLKSEKGNLLRFDFYLTDYNIFIEADGNQHYNKESKWYQEDTIKYDILKTEWCKSNNITLIRIPYQRNPSDEYIKKYINL